jgi:hypothetical protein
MLIGTLSVTSVGADGGKAACQPPASRLIEQRLDHAVLRLRARNFAQGELVYLEIEPDSPSVFPVRSPVCRFGEYVVRLSKRPWGYRGFIPVSGDHPSDETQLSIDYPTTKSVLTTTVAVPIKKSDFVVSQSSMEVGRFSNVNHARSPQAQRFIAESSAKKKKAFAHIAPDMLSSSFAHPRGLHVITSSFWSSRVYKRYKIENGKRVDLKDSRKVHRGLDLRGATGEPVYAIADGLVVMAEKTYYEGNFTVIDHGNRIQSYYMHQDSLTVSAGDTVRAGDQIGTVGSTGVSTAPHLHISLTVDRIQVDPLSLLSLPVR